jgi:transcriptional regulator with XRE-family HTH domain
VTKWGAYGILEWHPVWVRLPRTGRDLYKTVQGPAEAIKGYIQIIIGIAVIVIFTYKFISHGTGQFEIVGSALSIVGYGLAVSAAVELAYTFFTKGPDEALDPLILGVSSFTLIAISIFDPRKLNTSDAIQVSLLALAILLLFFARRFLLEVGEEGPDAEPSEAPIAFRIGQAVRDRRMNLGLSQGELAARAGISRRMLGAVEGGHAIPAIRVLSLISTALDSELAIEITPRKTSELTNFHAAGKPYSRQCRDDERRTELNDLRADAVAYNPSAQGSYSSFGAVSLPARLARSAHSVATRAAHDVLPLIMARCGLRLPRFDGSTSTCPSFTG